MNLLDHTDEHQATMMRDVIPTLIGQWVIVYVDGSGHTIQGTLREYNGTLLRVENTSERNYYVRSDSVLAISGES